MTAFFNDCGIYPISRDVLIICNIDSSIRGKISLKSFVGMGSKVQVEGLEDETIDVNSPRLMGVNLSINLPGLNVVPVLPNVPSSERVVGSI